MKTCAQSGIQPDQYRIFSCSSRRADAGLRGAYWYALVDQPWWPNMGLVDENNHLVGVFTGSEGTFGIATEIVVRLTRTPRAVTGTKLADQVAIGAHDLGELRVTTGCLRVDRQQERLAVRRTLDTARENRRGGQSHLTDIDGDAREPQAHPVCAGGHSEGRVEQIHGPGMIARAGAQHGVLHRRWPVGDGCFQVRPQTG